MSAPHQPPPYTRGEMVEDWTGCGIGSEAAEGVTSLDGLAAEPLPASHPAGAPSLHWEAPLPAPGAKRARAAPPAGLDLVCLNPSALPASVAASLPSAAQPHLLGGPPLPLGALLRPSLPRDATPARPASLGALVRFATLTAEVPPRASARLCHCRHPSADSLPGFVYTVGAGAPHPRPTAWRGLALGFPLGSAGVGGGSGGGGGGGSSGSGGSGGGGGETFLCTQGFGGRGHHRGAASHHSCDLACAEGTPVLAMADGVVVGCRADAALGGAHVDLLPECNFVKVRSSSSSSGLAFVVSYLHLAPGTVCVARGQAVRKGQELGRSGTTGFSLGPHLHVQVNEAVASKRAGEEGGGEREEEEEEEEGPSVMWAFEPTLPEQLPVVPTAGYYYSASGALAPNAAALQALRQRIGRTAPTTTSSEYRGCAQPPLHALAQAALLWLHPQAFAPLAEDALPLAEQPQAAAERCYPSLHTCLLANVLAPVALLVDGSAARFPAAFPPLYLSCQLNFERCEESGELFSCEVAQAAHQEGIAEELQGSAGALVAGVLDPAHGSDWQGFFRAKFRLARAWEVWSGEVFEGNRAARPAALRRGQAAYAVHTLLRSSLGGVAEEARGAAGARGGGGALCVFRQGPAQAQPFGVWLCWLVAPALGAGAGEGAGAGAGAGAGSSAEFVVVDLQNGAVSRSVAEAVALLNWEEAPREEVFWAAFA